MTRPNMLFTRPKHSSRRRFPSQFKPLCKALVLAGCFYNGVGQAAGEGNSNLLANYDSSMLWGGGAQQLDLSRYNEGNPVEAGIQSIDLSVNNTPMGRFDIQFIAGDKPGRAKPCLSRDLLARIGMNVDKLAASAQDTNPDQCMDLQASIEDASYSFDGSEQRLQLSVPQAYMQNNPRGYVNPERWDKGVNAAFFDYGINGYQSQSNGVTIQNVYASLNMGVNLGDWRLRQRSALNWGKESGSSHQSLSTYAQRDIDVLRSQLTLGDSFSDGELFDSVATRGIRLASDDRMLPDSLRGYAPVVRGIAATNARVTIRQNGYVIHESTVAPGAFEILDLNPTSDSGDLNVTVTEADGRESTFNVPFSSVARSLRPGASRYTTTVGQARDLSYGSKPPVAQATYQHGLTNLITGYTGASISEGYVAALIGGVLNTGYGAFGSDITGARTELGDKTFTGQSARVTYNKLLQSTGTNFSMAAYRYSTDGYFGFSDALSARDQFKEFGDTQGDSVAIRRARTRGEVNISQNIGSKAYVYLNASRQNYWNDTGSDIQYQAGYTQNWSWGSSTVSATRTQNAYGAADTQYMLNVSLPFGQGSNRPYLSSNISRSSSGASGIQNTLSGSAGEASQINYGITAGYDNPTEGAASSSLSGNSQYRTSYGTLNGSLSKGRDYQQASAGINGSVVAHPGGVTFGQNLGDSIAIIDAPGASGAQVSNASNGRALLILSQQADGSPLPFGAPVFDKQNQEVGAVGQGGQIFARVNGDQGTLHINLAEQGAKQCSITYDLKPREIGQTSTSLERLNAPCR